MEGSGGLSVSDLIEQHSRTNIPRPVPPVPPDNSTTTGRRALPDPPATGRRALPEPPAPQAPQPQAQPPQAPRQQPPSAHRPGEQTGQRPRPDQAAPQHFPGEPTGRRRAPDAPAVPPNAVPPKAGPPNGVPPKAAPPKAAPPTGAPANTGRPPAEQTGQRPRPDAGARRAAPGPHSGAVRPPEADATGTRRRPAPGEMGPGGTPPRRVPPGDAPSANAIPRPVPGDVPSSAGIPRPDAGQKRPPAPGGDPRRMPPGDVPSANGIPRRPAPGGAPEAPARRPEPNGAPPRRLAPGDAPSANAIPRPVPGDTPSSAGIPRPAAPGADAGHTGLKRPPAPDGPAPRRLLPGEAPSSNAIPRPPVPGEGEPTGRRPAPPARAESSGPRPMPPRAESSGPRPAPGIANRLGADAPAEDPGQEDTQIAAAVSAPQVEKREEMDPLSLTTEMEPIGDEVKKRREVDHTLARFSAVHDELLEQERLRKERRAKLMPWVKEEEDEEATQYADPVVVDSGGPRRPGMPGRTPKQRRLMRGAKVSAVAAAAVVFASTGIGWAATLWADSKFQKIEALGGNSEAVHQAEKQLGDENFLLVGSDTRAGAKPSDNVGTADQEGGARSDVIMLAHIPADRKRMVVVSLPRDVRVDRPACRSWDSDTGQYGEALAPAKEVMANSVYAEGGPECVANMMTQLSGLKINHFVSIDFVGFREMSTAIGGVEICTPTKIVDDELGVVIDKPGRHVLKGDQALQYVRARKVAGDSGTDFDRIKRQQTFLSAMLRQSLSNEVLLSPSKLNNFINALTSSTAGDNIDVASLLELANSLQSLDAGRVTFVTMPHWTDEGPTLSNDDNIERLKDDGVKELFQTIIDGLPLPQEKPAESNTGEAPPQQQPGTVIDPKEVTIQVFNGDPTNGGAADRTSNALQQKGFKVATRGNAPENAAKTTIRYSKGNENKAATLKAAVPSAELVEAPEMGGAVVLTLGADFDDKIVGPQEGTQQGNAGNQGETAPDLSVVNAAQDPCAPK
ncbi:transcriptional attenuator, LytR family [Lentzea fradiae]|uniref:Transcriptional attenuator, LytR family n=1 Tax=Lentzea fradiae TaxID=200378 RepID=A0A1G7MFR1_9PSEU|nr:LCP family protein [Lentzea fradiae]SDF60567.1 transcriptional attenuator, LytR family [Lentzea fradiae]